MPTQLRNQNASSESNLGPPTSDLRPPAPVSGVRSVVPLLRDSGLPETPPESRHRTSRLQSRCSHTYADGRRCRTTRAPHSSLCAQHARKALAPVPSPLATIHSPLATSSDDPDLSSDLLGPVKDFRTSAAVNHTLGKLLILIASNRISTRRAAVVAYTCQLLLQSLGGVKKEIWQTTDSEESNDVVQRVLKATSPLRGRNSRSSGGGL